MPSASNKWIKWLDLKPRSPKAEIDKHTIAKANGTQLMQRLKNLMTGDGKEVEDVIKWIEESVFLAKVYKDAIENRKEQLVSCEPESRVRLMKDIAEQIKKESPIPDLQDINES